jgi:lipopolysaccharide transport system permease protein
MLTVYTFIFSVIFHARWENGSDNKFEFAVMLFAGLIVFNLFSECLSRAPTLILANVNYVKKVVFPLEILPWVSLGSALFHTGVSSLVLLLFLLFSNLPVSWTILFFPFVLLPLLPLIMGISWALASLGVYIRDVSQMIGLFLMALMFMSPIFYPASALPASVRDYLFLNPLTFIIEQSRSVLIWGLLPNWQGLLLYGVAMIMFAWAGLFWFEKTRKGFADVI